MRDAAPLVGALQPSKLAATAMVDLAAMDAADDPERALAEMIAADGPELERTDPTTRTAQFLRLVRAALAVGRIDDATAWAAAASASGSRSAPRGPRAHAPRGSPSSRWRGRSI